MSKAKTTKADIASIPFSEMTFWQRNKVSHGYLLGKKAKNVTISVCRAILLFGLCFLILQPILSKISMSFMEEQDLYDSTVINIPAHFTLENYKLAAQFLEYGKAFVSTSIVSLTIALLQVAVCTVVGYGFARYEFPLKKFWFFCVLLTIVIPPQTISSSLYLNFSFFDIFGIFKLITGDTLNLRGSALPYYLMSGFCMGLKNGVYIFMTRQFFRNIPKDMEEAAYVDGCGPARTFLSVLLPSAKPILVSCFLFAFVWQWTDSFYSRLFLGKTTLLSTKLTTIAGQLDAYAVRYLGRPAGVGEGYTSCLISTGTLMVITPLIILYLFEQRGFTESLASTGIKG